MPAYSPVQETDPRWKRKPVTNIENAALCRALMGGTPVLRKLADKSRKYLPKFKKETLPNYKDRVRTSFAPGQFPRIVRDYEARVLGKPLTFPADGLDPDWELWRKNADGQGTSFDGLARLAFRDSLLAGAAFAGVDAPRKGKLDTFADGNRKRPWINLFHAEDIINWSYDTDEYGQVYINVLRVQFDKQTRYEYLLTNGRVTVSIWKDTGKDPDSPTRIYVKEGQDLSYPPVFTEIPIIPLALESVGLMLYDPPLMTIAELGEELWQAKSGHTNLMNFINMPILFGYGFDEKIEYGPTSAVIAKSEKAHLGFVEHNDKASTSSRQRVLDLKEEIEQMGIQFASERVGETATAVERDKAKENTRLQVYANGFQEGLNKLMQLVALAWGKEFPEGGVSVNSDIDKLDTSQHSIDVLLKLATPTKDNPTPFITRDELFDGLKLRGYFPSNWESQQKVPAPQEAAPEPPLDTDREDG